MLYVSHRARLTLDSRENGHCVDSPVSQLNIVLVTRTLWNLNIKLFFITNQKIGLGVGLLIYFNVLKHIVNYIRESLFKHRYEPLLLAYIDEEEVDEIASLVTLHQYQKASQNIQTKRDEVWPVFEPYLSDYEYFHSDDTDSDAYIMCNAERLVIAFRGTEFTLVDGIGIDDIITDLDVKPVRYEYCRVEGSQQMLVHRGFQLQYVAIRQQMRDYVTEKCDYHRPKKVLVTGHSLGGALATLCGLDLILNPVGHQPKVKIITIGSPRVGNDKFTDFFDATVGDCTRLKVAWDPVPTLPPEILGFKHVGREILLREASDDGILGVTPLRSHHYLQYLKATENSKKYVEEKKK